jgi:hypothetical protein
MRSFYTFIAFIVTSSLLTAGPFGFEKWMHREEVLAQVGQRAVKNRLEEGLGGTWILTTAPRPHSAFEEYILGFSLLDKLVKIIAVGKNIKTSGYGEDLQQAFQEMFDQLKTIYGAPGNQFDFVRADSAWTQPHNWMKALTEGERYLTAYWTNKLPNGLETIGLEAKALSPSTGYISLGYEFEGFAADVKARQKMEADKLK